MEITRRIVGKLFGAAAVVSGAPVVIHDSIASMPLNTIRVFDGTLHPVTPAWYARNVIVAGVTRMNEPRRLAILEVSNERHITPKERRELEALTDFLNVNTAYRVFGDFYKRHYPALDCAHGMLCTKPCGCSIHLMHDHYGNLPMHAHETRAACDRHDHPDAASHWAALQAEDRAAVG